MLDLKYLENHTQEAIERLGQRKGFPASDMILPLLEANSRRKRFQHTLDTLAADLRMQAKEVGRALAEGDEERAADLKQSIAQDKKKHKAFSNELKDSEKELHDWLLMLPNLPDPQVPYGKGPVDNQIDHHHGDVSAYAHATTPHWDLLTQYQLASFPLGTKLTGAGFPVYQGQGARLQRALVTFFLDQALAQGYQEVIPPLLVNEATAQGTGQLPDKEGLMYALEELPFYLIPTAEVPVTNLYRDTLLKPSQLPIRHVAYTSCFRKEAGSWGADVRGLNRLHQFDKVELVEVHHPSQSADALVRMRTYVQGLLEKLGLPYRTLLLCTGDLGHTAAITYDLEVWSAAQQRWLEVSSISSFHDYQARRMHLRYKEDGKNHFCHTLNGSALALPRVLAALLENYQTPTHINLPEVLHPYMGCDRLVRP